MVQPNGSKIEEKARQGKSLPCIRARPLRRPVNAGVENSLLLESESRSAGLNDRWTVPAVCIFLAAIVWMVFGQTLRYGLSTSMTTIMCLRILSSKRSDLGGFRWALTFGDIATGIR